MSVLFFLSTIFLILSNGYASSYPLYARANVRLDNSASVIGTLYFIQATRTSLVIIRGTLAGLVPNQTYHGFHVHTSKVSETRPNCTAAGAHFNPYNRTHGAPISPITQRHVGDLGNIYADQYGSAQILIIDKIIKLTGASQSIIERTIIVHRDVDDYGLGGQSDSLTTGHAGARIACGLIQSTSMTEKEAFLKFLS
ncbi:unnamed protein product [Didymodactylos carnosus]|uniref:Superoxide dismutase [Cu-Zn] n=1 Tax=Didymodactylos carnosus TaxID=1234261 RepID=A0A814DCH9_9BILA|nr:unnamed protein product [Didymodactylos carnosus]CAF1349579.1 unnamed protein product [Didymodactylos carnosus]CAF3729249.1 unnamed protein product [Didymodactylos carnosus]CAF4160290.1 unnamed protein product [Didymodactylos carnosus]